MGLQIPNFSYGTGVENIFPSVVAQTREAEDAGFDSVFLMDHFYQLPMLGSLNEPMLEAYTTLAALAGATTRIQLGTLVTGITYRNPALLAKIITTLDVVSAGRAILGTGAGWFEAEHTAYGFEYGTFTDRFERLTEALALIAPMIRGEEAALQGKWYRADSAFTEPRYRGDIPVMLGGSGERKTFRLAARYADHLNIMAPFSELKAKREVLARRCEEIDRDPATLQTSALVIVNVDETASAPEGMEEVAVFGSAPQIAEQLKKRVFDAGIDSVIVNLPLHGHTPGLITEVGKAIHEVLPHRVIPEWTRTALPEV